MKKLQNCELPVTQVAHISYVYRYIPDKTFRLEGDSGIKLVGELNDAVQSRLTDIDSLIAFNKAVALGPSPHP